MKDNQAAKLYFKYWQLVEGSSEGFEATEDAKRSIDAELEEGGYAPASGIMYDPYGEPFIVWRNSRFDWAKWLNDNWESLENKGD